MRQKKKYPWERFWCPDGASYSLGDRGYLSDPTGEHGPQVQPSAFHAEQVDEVPCVALLGDPGLGKTDALERFIELAKNKGEVIALNLRSYAQESRLCGDIFGIDFETWRQSDRTLTLVLDSLDECLLRAPQVAAMLVDELGRGYPLNRLRLRIACRSTEWPVLLSEELPKLWGEDRYQRFELLPLRRLDVELAANIESLDAASFLHEVERSGMIPFAIRPMRLLMLFDAFRRDRTLGGDLVTMFRQYCLSECQEENRSRQLQLRPPPDDADRMLAVGRRIAAVTIFARRPSVFVDTNHEQVRDTEDVNVRDLVGATELLRDREFEVCGEDVAKCLTTGLFSPNGDERRLWSHWSFAEFLAADFVAQRRLSLQQVEGLLFAQSDAGCEAGRVVPQLAETAAWISMMMADLCDSISQHDPTILLRSQCAMLDHASRSKIVDSLLRVAESGMYVRDFGERHRYDVLNHPDLPAQLSPWITGRSHSVTARRLAINITEAAVRSELEPEINHVLFSDDEDIYIRSEALDAWLNIVPSSRYRELKPLLGHLESDVEDELRGRLLPTLWPQHISISEMFANLSEPKRENFSGAYSLFLWMTLCDRLVVDDLPEALKWLQGQQLGPTFNLRFEHLSEKIIQAGFQHINDSHVFDAISETMCQWIFDADRFSHRGFSEHFVKYLPVDLELRMRLLCVAVRRIADSRLDVLHHWWELRQIAGANGIPELLTQFESAQDEVTQGIWAELIARSIRSDDRENVERALAAREKYSRLRIATSWLFDPIELNSDLAKQLRERYEEEEKREARSKRSVQRVAHPPVRDLVEEHLRRFENGDLDAWWQLHRIMTLDEKSDRYDFEREFVSDLTSLPSWTTLDESQQLRCVEAAESWLHEGDPKTDDWFATSTLNRLAAAGFRSLRLLQQLSADRLNHLSPEEWAKWTPIALAFDDFNPNDPAAISQILERCYQQAPQVFIQRFLQLIDFQNQERTWISVSYRVKSFWDDRLIAATLGRLQCEPTLKDEAFASLLDALTNQRHPSVYEFAKQLLADTTNRWSDEVRAHSAALLLSRFGNNGWLAVKPILDQQSPVAHRAVELLAHKYRGDLRPSNDTTDGQSGLAFSEPILAEFYIWLSKEFPHADDPVFDGAHAVGERESVQHMRDRILSQLSVIGTPDAVTELHRIREALPHLDWLPHTIALAARAARQRSWQALTPQQVIGLKSMKEIPIDFLVVTALEEERNAVLRKLENVSRISPSAEDVRVFHQGWLSGHDQQTTPQVVVSCVASMGRVKATTTTIDAIRRWKPKYIILCGIAGGFAANGAHVGDVLLAEQVVDYSLEKTKPAGSEIRFQSWPSDERLRNFAANLRRDEWGSLIAVSRPGPGDIDILRGPVATGDRIVESPTLIQSLLNHYPKLIGVEMEAGGVATACHESVSRPGFFMVRSVSDMADPDKESDQVKTWREYACDVAASFTIGMLMAKPLPSGS
ncbi:MAG: hypothetical protein ACKV2Q_33060 [Planctomycetaceae bacterium]